MSVPFCLHVSLGRVRAEVLGMDQTCGLPVGCEALSWLGPPPAPTPRGPSSTPSPTHPQPCLSMSH